MKVTLITNTPDPQRLIETCARISYNSKNDPFDPEVNSKFIRKLISMGHLSPFEHASATVLIENVSRTCSHQIVRHRIAAYSQRSGRYVEFDPKKCSFVVPSSVMKASPRAIEAANRAFDAAAECYGILVEEGVPKEDARFYLPQAEETSLYMTTNMHNWRHFLELRLDRHAQWEIQRVARMVLAILHNIAPDCFHDIACSFLGLGAGTDSNTVNTELTKYVVANIPDVRKELVDNAVRDVTKSMVGHLAEALPQ